MRKVRWTFISALVLLCLLLSDARAAEGASGTDLLNLIEQVGAKSNKHFIVDPRVRGTVEPGASTQAPLTYHMLLEVLGVHGFVAIPSGDVIKIVPEGVARTMATPVVPASDIKGDDAEVITAIIPLKNGDADKRASLLRPMVAQWGMISPSPDQKSLLVVDKVANIKRIVAVIKSQE